MQTSFVEVLLGNWKTTIEGRAFDQRVLAVYHNMVVDIDALVDPVAAGLGVGTLDYKLVQHRLEDLGDRQGFLLRVCPGPTCRTRLIAGLLGSPGMVETEAAEVVLAGEADRPIEGRVADETDEVAVAGGDVVEQVQVGRDLGYAALPTLRGR
jgi:hypothetical protein